MLSAAFLFTLSASCFFSPHISRWTFSNFPYTVASFHSSHFSLFFLFIFFILASRLQSTPAAPPPSVSALLIPLLNLRWEIIFLSFFLCYSFILLHLSFTTHFSSIFIFLSFFRLLSLFFLTSFLEFCCFNLSKTDKQLPFSIILPFLFFSPSV